MPSVPSGDNRPYDLDWPSGGDVPFHPDWQSGDDVPSNPPTNSPADSGPRQHSPSSGQQAGLLDDLSGAASFLNNLLSNSNNAVVGTGLLATVSALFSTANLQVHYNGGKPTLLQKIRGAYKFTVSADPSWTSKSKYSSNIARALHQFSKSTPTNRLVGLLQRHVASYQSPSALIKHMAGFSKNVNAAMHGSTLFSASTQRASKGALDLLGSAASNKGWTAGSRWIPYAGSVVSFVTHTSQEWQSPGRSTGEKIGRVLLATGSDVGAMWVGAKVGAAIGSVGGPVGIVVGGAVGALAGGIASSQFGDEIKQVGGKIGSAIEKGLNNAAASVNNAFRSVGAWFR